MKKYEWYLDPGFGEDCVHRGIVEVSEDLSEDEVEDVIREEALNVIQWGYHPVGGEE